VTTAPPDGAGPSSVTVLAVVDLPPTTDLGDTFTSAGATGFTVSAAVWWLVPSLPFTVTWVVAVTDAVEIVNGAEVVEPPATVTEEGTVATTEAELVSAMVAPLAGAAEVSVTVLAVVEIPPTTEKNWCGEGDLNPHEIAPASTSS